MPSTAVVVAFDPQDCVLLRLGEIAPGSGVDEFLFVGGKEGFGQGVGVS